VIGVDLKQFSDDYDFEKVRLLICMWCGRCEYVKLRSSGEEEEEEEVEEEVLKRTKIPNSCYDFVC
jgi:hypothetical protein